MSVTNQRERILDTALRLMSEQGAGSTSMRQLANACDLNVAALYHYFPSKDDILRSVIEERQYALQLSELPIKISDQEPEQLVSDLIVTMWLGAKDEERIWRLLLGESLRGDPTAQAVGRELVGEIERALRSWLLQLIPDLPDEGSAAVTLIMGHLYMAFMEQLFRPTEDDTAAVRAGGDTLAALIVNR